MTRRVPAHARPEKSFLGIKLSIITTPGPSLAAPCSSLLFFFQSGSNHTTSMFCRSSLFTLYRCSTAPPGPLQTRYALTLAAALLKSDQRDLVAIVASTLAGAPLAEADLAPMLRKNLDKLWSRSYECRVFVLQLLNSLAELDDRSLCMICSCFAHYLDEHSVPA